MTENKRKNRVATFAGAIGALGFAFCAAPAVAADLGAPVVVPAFEAAEPIPDWQIVLAVPGFLPWTNGTIRTGPAESDLYLSGWNALKNLKMMFVGELSVVYQGRVSATVENFYADLGKSQQVQRGANITLGFRESVTDARAGYRFINNSMGWLEGYAGIRWWDIRGTLSVSRPAGLLLPAVMASGSSGDSWVDPIIGFRTQYFLNDHWYLTGQADIGGFTVGSDFTWRAQGGGGYRFNEDWAVDVQYKAWGVDFDNNDPDSSRFAFDVIQQGPQVRLQYTF